MGVYNPDTVPFYAGIATSTRAGAALTEEQSLAVSTVYACVYKIATSMASTPLVVLEKENGITREATENPAYALINYQPNAVQTAFSFWEYIISQSLMYGVGYAVIERNNQGRAESITPVNFYDIEPKNVNGQIMYKVRGLGVIAFENMLVISNMCGLSPLRVQRDNIALAKAAQDYGSDFFGNGGQMTGILSTEQPLKAQQVDAVQQQWNQSSQTSGVKLLPFGFKYQPITVPPETMTFIETRQLQAEEIARAYQVPGILVGLGTATYDSVEQQNLLYKQQTLLPWAKRIQQEVDRKLLPSFERPNFYSQFRLSDMYKTDIKTQADFYTQMLQSGVLSINEVRDELEKNAVSGGSTHTVQVNQIALKNFEDYSEKISSEQKLN